MMKVDVEHRTNSSPAMAKIVLFLFGVVLLSSMVDGYNYGKLILIQISFGSYWWPCFLSHHLFPKAQVAQRRDHTS